MDSLPTYLGLVLLTVISAAPAAAQRAASPQIPPPPMCYTFVSLSQPKRKGPEISRLWVSCDGKMVPVGPPRTHREGYAISSSSMVLALVVSVPHSGELWRGEAFSLRPPFARLSWRVPSFNGVSATCGTITAWADITMDALTGRPLGTPAFPFVLCDRSGKVRAEADAATSGGNSNDALKIGKLRISVPNLPSTDMSPGGTYLAWSGSAENLYSWPVCVEQIRENAWPECASRRFGRDGQVLGVSVNDDGAVITSEDDNSERCNVCESVYWWRPGMAEPALLRTSAAGPHWVSRAAAQGLIARYRYLREPRRASARPPAPR